MRHDDDFILAWQSSSKAICSSYCAERLAFGSIIQHMKTQFESVGIVGAGAMGRGIAQIAAQAGSRVVMFDAQSDASTRARTEIVSLWDKLLAKGRLDSEQVAQYQSRLSVAENLESLSGCDLIVEAIVERLDAKAGCSPRWKQSLRIRRYLPPTPRRCRSLPSPPA
jgi:D-arabinose 1-dehydrogenase-like Zn-dependent alcohol dehydrogenase